jgi:hypothetical protein
MSYEAPRDARDVGLGGVSRVGGREGRVAPSEGRHVQSVVTSSTRISDSMITQASEGASIGGLKSSHHRGACEGWPPGWM